MILKWFGYWIYYFIFVKKKRFWKWFAVAEKLVQNIIQPEMMSVSKWEKKILYFYLYDCVCVIEWESLSALVDVDSF